MISSQDTILLGRHTYDYWVGFWPTDGPEPFHSFINDTEKHVFTSNVLERDWDQLRLGYRTCRGPRASAKQSDGGDIGVHGSIQLSQSLGAAGLSMSTGW